MTRKIFHLRQSLEIIATLLVSVSCANAATINFDGYNNTAFGDEITANGFQHAQSGGFDFFSSVDHFHFISIGPSNGTSSLLEDRPNATIAMTRVGGGTFDLLTLLGYTYLFPTGSITVTGFFGSSSTSHTFNVVNNAFTATTLSGFNNLTRAEFYSDVYFGIENIEWRETSGAVPEPTSIALMGLGLAGMGFARHRKSIQA